MILVLLTAVSIVAIMIGEYLAHKYLMHNKLSDRFEAYYIEHHLQHHAHNRLDVNIDLWPFAQLLLFSPLIVLIWWFFPVWAYISTGLIIFHSLLWSVLHRSYHDLGCKWIKYVFPFYNRWRKHHLDHHLQPSKNLGAAFGPIPDAIVGTKWLS